MIQLRVIRPRFKGAPPGDESNKKLARDVTAGSLQELFSHAEDFLAKIPETERWNVFYTIGNTDGGDKQIWSSQEAIAFDIDGILDENGESDDDLLPRLICEALSVDIEKCVVVKSGNGLQVLVQPYYPISEVDFFRKNKFRYDELCLAIDAAIKAAGLRGSCDRSVFTPNHLFRFPLTENRKPGKAVRQALLLRRSLQPQKFAISPPAPGIKAQLDPWETAKGGSLPLAVVNSFKIDSASVENGCMFLQAAKSDQGSVSEAQWYAMLSIVGRLENGREKAHEYSKEDRRYSKEGTDRKLDHALSSSGPRTCSNIETLWDGCTSCPNYRKVNSPVSIKSNEFIATEETGFHILTEKGGLKPQVSDLRKFFEREHPYRVNAQSGSVYVYEDGMYRQWSIHELRAFAQKHFYPEVSSNIIQEFTQSIARINLVSSEWFHESIRNQINFKNGVFDVKKRVLEEHSPRWGFLHKLPFDYAPDEACPNFDKFMSDITCGDAEVESILLEFVGYAICDRDYWMQKALILIGGGSNGKSSFFEIVEALIGEANTSHLNFESLKAETSLSHLQGKLINIGDELPSYTVKSTDFFKKLFGGRVLTRKLYHDSEVLRNSTKFMFSGNDMPTSEDVSHGFLRRLVIVPFNANFAIGSNADPDIVRKVKKELSGIFNRVMAAYEKMEKRGDFTYSMAVASAISEYKKTIDELGTWFEENIVVLDDFSEAHFLTVPALYERFTSECIRSNIKVMSRITFVKRIAKIIPAWEKRYSRMTLNGERVRVILGVRVPSQADEIAPAIKSGEKASKSANFF